MGRDAWVVRRITGALPETEQGEIGAVWRSAIATVPHSCFQSWPWVSHWLASLEEGVELFFVGRAVAAGPPAAGFFGRSREVRHKFLKSWGLHLNYTGLSPYDNLTLEYNQIPSGDTNRDLFEKMVSLVPCSWDELHLPAMDRAAFPAAVLDTPPPGLSLRVSRVMPSRYVDLAGLSADLEQYLGRLSRNPRQQIRRARRELEKQGTVTTTVARDLGEALSIYDELIDLHQRTWVERNRQGAFASDWFRRFHEEFIRKRFSAGEIQLLRVSCAGRTVGCKYNLVHQGVVYGYQGGFNYPGFPSAANPGLICHAEAILHSAACGYAAYDLLSGDQLYKKHLSTHTREMVWATLRKPRLGIWLEDRARDFKRFATARDRKAAES